MLLQLGLAFLLAGNHVSAQRNERSDPQRKTDGVMVILQPGYHWEHDPSDLNHLRPNGNKRLHYWEGGYKESRQYLSSNTTFNYPTIVLDHSSFVQIIVRNDQLKVIFSSLEAYYTANQSWPQDGELFLLVTSASSESNQYDYHVTTSPIFDRDSLSCTCTTEMQGLGSAAISAIMEWGQYTLGQDSDDLGSSPPGVGNGNNGSGPCPSTQSTTDCESLTAVGATIDFDTVLDNQLGYLGGDQADFAMDIKTFAAGVNNTNLNAYDYSDYTDDTEDVDSTNDSDGTDIVQTDDFGLSNSDGNIDLTSEGGPDKAKRNGATGHLLKRTSQPVNPPATATNIILGAKKAAANATKSTPQSLKPATQNSVLHFITSSSKTILSDYQTLKSFTNKVLPVFTSDDVFTIPNATSPGHVDQTYFLKGDGSPRNAISIYNYSEPIYKGNDVFNGEATFNVYCLDCGVTGSVRISGSAAVAFKSGITQAQVTIHGNLTIGIGIGIAAELKLTGETSIRLIEEGIPGFSVPDVITVGPMVTVDVDLGYRFDAVGKVMFGGTIGIANASAELDLLHPKAPITPNWTPLFQSFFQATGDVALTASAQLPIGLMVGIDIGSGLFTASVGIVSTPQIQLNAEVVGTVDLAGKTFVADLDTSGCAGLAYSVNAGHSLELQGEIKPDTSLQEINLAGFQPASINPPIKLLPDYAKNLLSGCFRLNNNADQSSRTFSIGNYFYSDGGSPNLLSVSQPTTNNQTVPDIRAAINQLADSNVDVGKYVIPTYVNSFLNDTKRNFTAPLDAGATLKSSLSFNYTFIQTIDQTVSLIYGVEDGNLHIQVNSNGSFSSSEGLFEDYNDVVVGDFLGRILFYYPDEMSTYNVSRIRLGNSIQIPKTTAIMTLVPYQYRAVGIKSRSVLLPANANNTIFYTVACSYADGQATKVFIAADPDKGTVTLERTDLQGVITGGIVSNCFGIPFSNGIAGL